MKIYRPPDNDDEPWPFVRQLVHLDVAESTNDLAKQLACEGRDDLPLAVWADRQTRGRGQRDRSWWSDAGSLTFSLLLDPRMHGLSTEQEPRLALTVAVAVADAFFSGYRVSAEIRWPNDVECDGRKLGGILPERVETPRGAFLVIGIGLNVSTRFDDAPAEVRQTAVSLHDLISPPRQVPDNAALLRRMFWEIETRLKQLARGDREVASDWQGLNCLFNRPVRVDLGPRILTGICRAIDEDGALVVEADGKTHRLFGGRVLRE